VASTYAHSYLLALSGWSGADMANFFKPDGTRLYDAAHFRQPIAPRFQATAHRYGARAVIPFSSFHRYQRSDSIWANELVPNLPDYYVGAGESGAPILPAFVRVDAATGDVLRLDPAREQQRTQSPETLGDSWSDQLEPADIGKLRSYFETKE